jgi:hypothetical protein
MPMAQIDYAAEGQLEGAPARDDLPFVERRWLDPVQRHPLTT